MQWHKLKVVSQTMDKETIKILVYETLNTKGWGIIEEEINRMIGAAKTSLVTVNPSDPVLVARLQEKVNTCKRTLQIVHNMVK